ncbi:MAG: hypothetical protein A2017_18645 [Lentisphaerae bacterium GWF2_44_16]|nr:MAG: hypothetical protein A2017_18645 [Lentisphaerae bacterium GWF2_44_16]
MLKQFLKNPVKTGALCASSPLLSKTMTEDISIEKAKSVVELGPGTGAVTRHIIKSISNETVFFAVELNEEFLHILKEKFPDVKFYNDTAANLNLMASAEGLSNIDVIVSGLPWASFSPQLQEELLSAITKSLSPGGIFTTFAYLQGMLLPSAWNFKKLLNKHFSVVAKSHVVWRNIPPAFVYRCRK